jgi:glycosyltransferase involved in cell wall biosynthesis
LIVLPVLNEEIVLAENARRLSRWCEAHLTEYAWRICIADNGSTDRTVDVARAVAREDARISLFSIAERGRGRALSRVWTSALGTADIFAYMDVDLSADLAALPALLACAADGVAYGSRFAYGATVTRSVLREITSRGYLFLLRWILGLDASDAQCGFKAISAASWDRLRAHVTHPGWFWDTEVLLCAERLRIPVRAVPVSWVETRDLKRKSSVRLVPTILGYLRDIFVMRLRLWRGE